MTNKQLTEVKETFKRLESILSQASSVESLFTNERGFREVFEKARRLCDSLINEPVVKTEYFDFREAIRFVVEQLENLQDLVENGVDHLEVCSLQDRLSTIKAAVKDVNQCLNRK